MKLFYYQILLSLAWCSQYEAIRSDYQQLALANDYYTVARDSLSDSTHSDKSDRLSSESSESTIDLIEQSVYCGKDNCDSVECSDEASANVIQPVASTSSSEENGRALQENCDDDVPDCAAEVKGLSYEDTLGENYTNEIPCIESQARPNEIYYHKEEPICADQPKNSVSDEDMEMSAADAQWISPIAEHQEFPQVCEERGYSLEIVRKTNLYPVSFPDDSMPSQINNDFVFFEDKAERSKAASIFDDEPKAQSQKGSRKAQETKLASQSSSSSSSSSVEVRNSYKKSKSASHKSSRKSSNKENKDKKDQKEKHDKSSKSKNEKPADIQASDKPDSATAMVAAQLDSFFSSAFGMTAQEMLADRQLIFNLFLIIMFLGMMFRSTEVHHHHYHSNTCQ